MRRDHLALLSEKILVVGGYAVEPRFSICVHCKDLFMLRSPPLLSRLSCSLGRRRLRGGLEEGRGKT